jgi:hypothetical protein
VVEKAYILSKGFQEVFIFSFESDIEWLRRIAFSLKKKNKIF